MTTTLATIYKILVILPKGGSPSPYMPLGGNANLKVQVVGDGNVPEPIQRLINDLANKNTAVGVYVAATTIIEAFRKVEEAFPGSTIEASIKQDEPLIL